ncbi:valine--tRNA ligase [Candidatus Woesearchaeota archaeon]|nr:valine--tRNA ligase [Candidatus Woesearchaeota archaeon]
MLKPRIKENKWEKELEKPIYELWKKNKSYKYNSKSKRPIYSIDTPPPYINTPVHIAQATTYVIMDMFARFKRMTGHEVIFPLGLDKNGLPIEVATEKKFNINLVETPREKFIEYCKRLLDECGSLTKDSFLRLGVGFNSFEEGKEVGDVYETDSEDYRILTQSTFIDLWNKGLIYEDTRINNWDTKLQTTIADSEIEYMNLPSVFYDVIFKVKETEEEIVIGTTRPELICACGAVIFNPEDVRYKHLAGKTAITPVYEKEIPIKAHPLAEINKGTGLVMMCSAGDLSDIRFFREMSIEPIMTIEKDGRMNSNAGFLNGLKVKEAREKMVNELKKNSLLVKQTKTTHRTPVSERSGAEIEFISMSEFYLKQTDQKEKMKEIANKIKFYSPNSKNILLDWIDSVTIDWPISRRRYYATEIPLWYCKYCNETIVPKKGRYYQPWKEEPLIKKCPMCDSKEFVGETRVFDTWFDSSSSPLYILKYGKDDKFFKKATPCSLRPQGKEIVRTWLYYTLLKSYLLTGKPIFENVWINYHIVDNNGHKMSKSKGNVVDPREVLDRFGAEPFRLWATVEGNLEKTDFRFSFERIEGAGKTINKLWNIARFISMFPESKKPARLETLDLWIINEINEMVKFSKRRYEQYDFHNPAVKLRNFIWETFASHYLELVKSRAYNQDKKFTKQQQNSALFTLHYCLDRILKLLSPITPFITYKIYNDLKKKDIHFEEFPKADKIKKISFSTKDILQLNSKVWKHKKDKGVSLKDGIDRLTINKKFKPILKDIEATHKPREIKFGKLNISS